MLSVLVPLPVGSPIAILTQVKSSRVLANHADSGPVLAQTSTGKRSSRFESLDGLRGVAAFIVVLHHCTATYFGMPFPSWIRYSPLRLVTDGRAAVLVFFVLSGFVLFYSLQSRRGSEYWSYITKRFLRIYPPFAVAILASALLWTVVQPHVIAGLSAWFNYGNWQPRPTVGLVAAHLAMTNNKDFQGLDVVMWSLVHEARISVIFPVIALCVTRNWLVTFLLAAIISEASRRLAAGQLLNLWYSPVDTLQFVILFVCGAVLAQKSSFIRNTISSLSVTQTVICWIAALAALVSSTSSSSYSIFAEAGAAIVVALSFADTSAAKLLSSPFPAWLGKISYSLYLVHLPVLFALVHIFWGHIPLVTILGIAVASSLILADVMYRFVEAPSIALGRVLVAKFTRRVTDLESAPA